MSRSMKTYDELAMKAMLTGNQTLVEDLLAHAQGKFPCPDCGSEGPHHVQNSGFGYDEFSCTGCGMVHVVPPVPEPRGR